MKSRRHKRPTIAKLSGGETLCSPLSPPNKLASLASAARFDASSVSDARVRAVVALAPLGAVFDATSLERITVPTAIFAAAKDRFLVVPFHADWVAAHMPAATFRVVLNAWHFVFMDPPSGPIPSDDGDLRDDPPGFDRQAFLRELQRDVPAFFDAAFAAPSH